MSVTYQAVGWNRSKRIYDGLLASGIALYLVIFIGLGTAVHPGATIETLLIRAMGTAALLLLHVILAIGPLCRLDRRFLPLLYNRRHFGVTMFSLGLGHGVFSMVQFHALGNVGILTSLFTSNTRYDSLSDFPFQALGVFALLILFLMAATSHDFWLKNLSPAIWKRLHMMVYVAYALLVGHVTLGALQSETSRWLAGLLAAGMVTLIALHLAAARREASRDVTAVDAGEFATIPEGRARVISLQGERIAVFRHQDRAYALSNVCAHQNGPLGEGRILDGCITCPWHGYQYSPETGAAPPPFTEKVATFATEIRSGRVYVSPCTGRPHG